MWKLNVVLELDIFMPLGKRYVKFFYVFFPFSLDHLMLPTWSLMNPKPSYTFKRFVRTLVYFFYLFYVHSSRTYLFYGLLLYFLLFSVNKNTKACVEWWCVRNECTCVLEMRDNLAMCRKVAKNVRRMEKI